MFNLADDWKTVERPIDRVRMLKGENQRGRVLTSQEEKRYLARLLHDWRSSSPSTLYLSAHVLNALGTPHGCLHAPVFGWAQRYQDHKALRPSPTTGYTQGHGKGYIDLQQPRRSFPVPVWTAFTTGTVGAPRHRYARWKLNFVSCNVSTAAFISTMIGLIWKSPCIKTQSSCCHV
jgi:hypothetical protein